MSNLVKKTIKEWIVIKNILEQLQKGSDPKFTYACAKVCKRITSNESWNKFWEKVEDAKIDYAVEKDGGILRGENGEPVLAKENITLFNKFYNSLIEESTAEIEPYFAKNFDLIKNNYFLLEELNGVIIDIDFENYINNDEVAPEITQ